MACQPLLLQLNLDIDALRPSRLHEMILIESVRDGSGKGIDVAANRCRTWRSEFASDHTSVRLRPDAFPSFDGVVARFAWADSV